MIVAYGLLKSDQDTAQFLMEFRPQETSIGFVKPTDKEPFDIKAFLECEGYEN